jgi:hypothetical protein
LKPIASSIVCATSRTLLEFSTPNNKKKPFSFFLKLQKNLPNFSLHQISKLDKASKFHLVTFPTRATCLLPRQKRKKFQSKKRENQFISIKKKAP